MIGLFLGLLFFPSIDFSKSLLIGVIFDKSNFNEIFTNSLLFWSFLFATFFTNSSLILFIEELK